MWSLVGRSTVAVDPQDPPLFHEQPVEDLRIFVRNATMPGCLLDGHPLAVDEVDKLQPLVVANEVI